MLKREQSAKYVSYAALIILLFLIPMFIKGEYTLHVLILIGINIILVSSLRTIASSGLFSIAHAGFMAIGAYTSTLLVMKLGFSTWAALPLGGIAAGLLALLIGYPFVRVKAAYFAMLTLFTGQVIQLVIVEWRGLTGGSMGILNVPRPNPITILGLFNITFDTRVPCYYLILVLMLIVLLFLYRIEITRIGKTLLAIQQSDSIAASVGINIARYKVLALCIGCFFAGIAGSFYAHYTRIVTPTSFGLLQSTYIIIYMIVGGRGKFSGPIWGALILTLIPEIFSRFQSYQPFVFVAALFLVIFFLPEGLAGLTERARIQITKFRKGSPGNA
jgi:branched-chain amino acid transport system permease protein